MQNKAKDAKLWVVMKSLGNVTLRDLGVSPAFALLGGDQPQSPTDPYLEAIETLR